MLVAIARPAGAGKIHRRARRRRRPPISRPLHVPDPGRCTAPQGLAKKPAQARIDLDGERVLLDGDDVTDRLRTPEASENASRVAADPRVRRSLVEQQRRIVSEGDWVAEGRDIGTVVAPDAEVKVFLTADPHERARRRAEELGADVDQVFMDQQIRDQRDSEREDSPLKAAEDAVDVDTTGLTVDEVVARIVALADQARAS
jgi:cytidylate kinase